MPGTLRSWLLSVILKTNGRPYQREETRGQGESSGAAHVGERGRTPFPCMCARRRYWTSWDAAPCPCALLGVLGLSEPGGVLGLVLFCRLFASCPLRGGDSERLVWGQCCQLRRRFLARLSVQETACRWRRHRYMSTQRTAALALSTPESSVLDNSNASSHTCSPVRRFPAGGPGTWAETD